MTQRESVLVLHALLGAGVVTVEELVEAFSPLEVVFGASEEELLQVPGMGERRAERILKSDPEAVLKGLYREIEDAGCQVVTLVDEDFPAPLRGKKGIPAVLFFQGELGCLSAPAVSVVGTRRATSYGNQVAYSMGRDLTIHGVMVISGMAIGIDTAAHEGALEEGATVAVLGSGLARLYPPQNRGLACRIRDRGLLLSPFSPSTSPARWTFPKRNRLMAALSEGVVVVEAGEKSGALLTARYAAEMGVPVFAVPGRVDRSQAKGVLDLLKKGAKVAAGAADVLEQLSIHPNLPGGEGVRVGRDLEGKEQLVWQALDGGDLPPEMIAQRVGVNLSEIWEVLFEMEMKGLISRAAGGVYSRRVL